MSDVRAAIEALIPLDVIRNLEDHRRRHWPRRKGRAVCNLYRPASAPAPGGDG